MATFKITELTELASGSEASTDVLPIVDITADETKKYSLSSLRAYCLPAIGDAISGGDTNGLLYKDASGNIDTNAALTYDESVLYINKGAGFKFGEWSISTSYSAMMNGSNFVHFRALGSASYYNYSDPLRFTFNDSERGRFNSSGLLLGTTSGTAKLNVDGNVNFKNLPTSAGGLSTGDLWNDSGTIKVV